MQTELSDPSSSTESLGSFRTRSERSISPSSSRRGPSTTLSSRLEARHAKGKSDISTGTGTTDDGDQSQLKRHPDLWFDDGSVICRAENTLFRVHMSQLSRHSICFRDMFSFPQPHRSDESNGAAAGSSSNKREHRSDSNSSSSRNDPENCPVVYLHDAAEDVGNLLTAMYDGPSFGNNDREDFRIVSGILRLSTKYMIDSLRAKALAHLSVAWPCTLKGWDAREDLARTYEIESITGNLYPSPISVINLAREVDAPQLLPSAFYDLSRYSSTQIFEPNEDEPLYRPDSDSSPPLSTSDMQRLALGKESAQHTITSLIQAMGEGQYVRQTHHLNTTTSRTVTHIRRTSGGGICVSAVACRKDFSELVDLATQHYLFDRERGCCDPLYVAEELGQLKSAEFSECKACAKALESWAGRERERMWKLIPLWFRLEHGTSVDGGPTK